MSFTLHPYAISNILIIITFLPISIILFVKRSSKLALAYSINMLCVSIWGIGALLGTLSTTQNTADFFLTIGYLGVLFISPMLLLCTYIIIEKQINWLIYLSFLQAAFFSFTLLTHNLFKSPEFLFDSFYYYSNATPLYFPSFIFWIIITIYAYTILILNAKNFITKGRKEFFTLICASIGYLGGIMNFLPQLSNGQIYPLGNFLVGPAGLGISYLIFKHQAFEVKIAIEKSIVYSTLIVAISILYLIVVLSLERAFAHFFNYQSITISIASAFGIGLLVFPLRSKIQQIMDRYFFSGTQLEVYEKNLRLQAEVEQSQRLKTATTLASGLAHEIKNPLTAITTFAEYLKEKKDDPEFIDNFSKIVGQEAERINDLVNQLTDFAKPGESTVEANDIHPLIEQTIQFLTSQCLKQHITIKLDYHTPEKVTLNIDAKQIKQVLMNIFLNAIEIMDKGGEILIRDEIIDATTDHRPQTTDNTKNPSVVRCPLSIVPDQKTYRLLITDTGPGIDPDHLPHIFDPFFSKKNQGTGLGLSVSYGIIEKHGGQLYAENNAEDEPTGATFIVEIPLLQNNS